MHGLQWSPPMNSVDFWQQGVTVRGVLPTRGAHSVLESHGFYWDSVT